MNTIGNKKTTNDCGCPESCWDILTGDGQAVIGQIEAEYTDANENRATRERRFVVSGYRVWWYAADAEGWFATSAHGTSAKALSAAKAYAKAAN